MATPGMRLPDILARLEGGPSRLCFISDKGAETLRTFDDLYRDTRALAGQLERLGVRPGSRIGLLGPNAYPWMVWDLAIMTLGGVSVALPQERLAGSVAEVASLHGLSLLVSSRDWIEPAAAELDYVIDIEQLVIAGHKRALQPAGVLNRPGTHSLVFSSGTTGKTKGLIISASGTEKLLDLYADAFGIVDGDRLLTFLPFANYQQRMAYYFCLYHGIDFVYVPFTRLFAGLKKYQPTYVIAPPVFYESLQNMAQSVVAPGADGAAPLQADIGARVAALLGGRIRYMITGMAPIKRQTLDFFWRHGISLYEAFGITEAGMVAWNKPGRISLGTVGTPAEPGSVSLTEEGEVVITRDCLLSLGYFDASEEDTRSTFIGPNSVATGDIARFDQDGFLTIVGRKKDAIITKAGEKFHPEPIESLIQSNPAAKVAVVLGGEGLAGVVALISMPAAGDQAATATIRDEIGRINATLPVFQQVKRVEFTTLEFSIDNGFRTKNMKLNRQAIQRAYVQHGIGLGQPIPMEVQ